MLWEDKKSLQKWLLKLLPGNRSVETAKEKVLDFYKSFN